MAGVPGGLLDEVQDDPAQVGELVAQGFRVAAPRGAVNGVRAITASERRHWSA